MLNFLKFIPVCIFFFSLNSYPSSSCFDLIKIISKNKNILRGNVSKLFGRFQEVAQRPKVLMAASEWGTVFLNGKKVKATVGGLGTVMQDLVEEYPKYFKGNSGGDLSIAVPAYKGVPLEETKLVDEFTVQMRGKSENVKVYAYEHESGTTIQFIDHPVFRNYAIDSNDHNLYQKLPHTPQFAQRPEWEDAYKWGLFNKAIAQWQKRGKYNVYHAHDNHTALAAVHMDDHIAVTPTIHNAGPGYQGVYWTHNYGISRIPHPDYGYGVPTGDWGANDQLLELLGVDFDTYIRHFEKDGQFNTLKGLSYIGERNLIWGSPVSDGYAADLTRSIDEIHGQIFAEKGTDALNPGQVFIPNGGNHMGILAPVTNGLGDSSRSYNHPGLLGKPADRLNEIDQNIPQHLRKHWQDDGLAFGRKLQTEADFEAVHKRKALIKKIAQEAAGIEVNPFKPLFVLVSRFSDQKNIEVFARSVEHIVSKGGQVIVGGAADDAPGKLAADLFHQLEEKFPKQVKYFPGFVGGELRGAIQAGGDLTVITSKFAPCELVDIEASYLGTVVISRKVGGLGKIENAFYYKYSDNTDLFGEVEALKRTIDEALEVYYHNHEQFRKMRINAMKEQFPWSDAITKYHRNYQVASLYKVIREMDQQLQKGSLTMQAARAQWQYISTNIPDQLLNYLKELLRQKPNLTEIEKHILNQ